jgi:hypothetical protein
VFDIGCDLQKVEADIKNNALVGKVLYLKRISQLAKEFLAPQEGFSSMELF